MRRFARWLFVVASAGSLLLLVAVLMAARIGGANGEGKALFERDVASRRVTLRALPGGLQLIVRRYLADPATLSRDGQRVVRSEPPPFTLRLNRLGFASGTVGSMEGPGGPMLVSDRIWQAAYGSLALAAAVLPGLFVAGVLRRRGRRRRRAAENLCAQCGYDLRATPGRCPECGRVPEGRSAASGGERANADRPPGVEWEEPPRTLTGQGDSIT